MFSPMRDYMEIDTKTDKGIYTGTEVNEGLNENIKMEIEDTASTSNIQPYRENVGICDTSKQSSRRNVVFERGITGGHRSSRVVKPKSSKSSVAGLPKKPKSNVAGLPKKPKSSVAGLPKKPNKPDASTLSQKRERAQIRIALELAQLPSAKAKAPPIHSSFNSPTSIVKAANEGAAPVLGKRQLQIELTQQRMVQELQNGLSNFDAWIVDQLQDTIRRSQAWDLAKASGEYWVYQTQPHLKAKGKEVITLGRGICHLSSLAEIQHLDKRERAMFFKVWNTLGQTATCARPVGDESGEISEAKAEVKANRVTVVDQVSRALDIDMDFIDRIKTLTLEDPSAAAEEFVEILEKIGQLKLDEEKEEGEL